jgi:hypothetical protein
LKVAWLKAVDRTGGASIGVDDVQLQVLRFFELPITPFAAADLAATALDLVRSAQIAPPDSWYVACALLARAELWLSHPHGDGLAQKARDAGADVHILVDERFQ